MNWSTLFTTERIDSSPSTFQETDSRHSFQKDFDRIIFSTAFRRLQDKTQVFPLPGPTFVHNRLTHSLEVACVGRSLAEQVGQILCVQNDFDTKTREFYLHQFPWVIASACLAHDLGNPPFGHSGEDAIRHFFSQPPTHIREWIEKNLSETEILDLKKFEGNSMAFRFLVQNESNYHSGLNLTKTTIASIIKYPCSASDGFVKGQKIIQKKSNFFTTESDIFNELMAGFEIPKIDNLQLAYARHPFVYLTEAADDICYRIIDLEDARRIGIINSEKFIEMVYPFFNDESGIYSQAYVDMKLLDMQTDDEKISFLRAMWIGKMVKNITYIFIENADRLLAGNLEQPLLDLISEEDIQLLKVIEDYSVRHVYKHKESVAIELSGYKILYQILDDLMSAIVAPDLSKSKLILHYLNIDYKKDLEKKTHIQKVMHILDFVTASTDNYSMDFYKKISALIA